MVIYDGLQRFYSRNSTEKYPLDVQEIHAAVLASATRRGVRAPFYMKVGRNWGSMSSSTKEADIQFLVGRLRDFYQSANS